ncbi:nucleoside/nucleotide kinase family protein [Frigoribacterium sp. 2-23]|uniref:nucleoside/nucleotide kinase family protein n=1 Tax=Frigoribacterium sp. 2-23 TaxID=3415006 RepID=UPI003C6F65DA
MTGSPAVRSVRWDEAGRRDLLTRASSLLEAPGRALLGIAGAPGAGKSTIAEGLVDELAARYPGQVALVPMDGYHLAQSLLEARGLAARKGAPDTFDARGYVRLLAALRESTGEEVFAPEFRREIEDGVAGAIAVGPDVRLVVTEGNYLLLGEGAWGGVAPLLDESWFVRLEQEERVRRLVTRHLSFDRERDGALAEWRATVNDEANARLVAPTAERADLIVEHPAA